MHDHLRAVVARAIDLSPRTLRISARHPLDHQSNRLYDVWAGGRHFLLKEYLKIQEFAEAPWREFRALEILAPLDIAPRPIFVYAEPEPPVGPIVVYEYMDGDMWERLRPAPSDLAALAEVWLRMHAIERDDLWLSRGYEHSLSEVWTHLCTRIQGYVTWVNTAFPEGRDAAKLCADTLDKCGKAIDELDGHDPPLCFCRADARFANVIRRPDGRLGLVDWEDSGLRDPARDVADLLTHPNQEDLLSPDEWQAFFDPYLAGRERGDRQLHHRVHLSLAVFPIYWLATFLGRGIRRAEAGQLGDWTINGLLADVRLRRYLARALAWPAPEMRDRLASLGDLRFFPTDR